MVVVEANAAPTLPPPPRASASSPPTVGTLLTRASAAVTNSGASRDRERSSPRSLLSRILHRRGRGGDGSGCRLRLCLPLPRYCSSGADVAAVKDEAAAPNPVGSRAEPPLESPRNSLAGKKALPASLGLGVSLVLLFSKVAAELSRMAELRAQMERLMMDVRADVRCSRNGRPSASDGHADDSAKKLIAFAGGDEDGALSSQSRSSRRTGSPASNGGISENVRHRETMDQMEAELEAELLRLQMAWNDDEGNKTPRRDHQVEAGARSGASSGRSHSVICSESDIDDGDDDERNSDTDDMCPPLHGGVPARELERRLHELLQSRHEARIAELESELERARRKLEEKEREACRWRDTAKLSARFTDESRIR